MRTEQRQIDEKMIRGWGVIVDRLVHGRVSFVDIHMHKHGAGGGIDNRVGIFSFVTIVS